MNPLVTAFTQRPFSARRKMSMSFSRTLLGLVLLGLSTLVATAGNTFVLNIPNTADLPAWLQIKNNEQSAELDFSTLDFTLTPPDTTADLAVTFYFTETEGGALRVFWQGDGKKAETLSDNLYEGVAMANQRTLLISKTTIGSGGTLTVQVTNSAVAVTRIEWSWVTPTTVVTADKAATPSLFRIGNQSLQAADVSGDAPAATPADKVRGNVVSAIIHQNPIRIDEATDFIATLEATPRYGRIEVQLLGVPLNRNIAVWINNIPVNQLSLDTPDLNSSGYTLTSTRDGSPAQPVYTGWRKGSILLPSNILQAGENHFRFVWIENDSTAASVPLALKNFNIQLNYDTATTATGVTGSVQSDQGAITP
jgi:hypothetical protein